MKSFFCVVPVALFVASLASAQHLAGPPPLPHQGFSPLLYVRFVGPAGLKVTFYQGQSAGREFQAPVKVGLRPGYCYRIRVSGFPGHPETILFPSLEVRGTLSLPPHLCAADHPAPIVFHTDDVDKVQAGTVLTEVVTLEHPDKAVPVATRRDEPVESQTEAGRDPLEEARQRGRPMVIVRLGQRDLSPEQLSHVGIPGTILLPGDRSLGPPAAHPWIPWACVPLFDPLLGARMPEEECLRDGGDGGQPAGLDRDGRLHGLDPADTVAEYSDSKGRRRLAISNPVCICVPRFVVIRSEVGLAGFSSQVGLVATSGVKGEQLVQGKVPSKQTRQYEHLAGIREKSRLSGAENVQSLELLNLVEVLRAHQLELGLGELLGTSQIQKLTKEQRARLKRQVELALQSSLPYRLTGVEQIFQGAAALGRYHGLNVIATVQGPRDLTVTCKQPPVPPPPDKPLVLHKWADRQCAQIGDVVTFFLKYSNHGGGDISDVAISDSLTGRLEYVPGSAKADRDAVFTLQANEAGSVILRWEINGALHPGQCGVVSFQARVR
jgi:uncharacterized repeat protein (TIGR01451 family)